MQWLGDVSYSVYLWHWPLIVIVPVAVGRSAGSPAVAVGILVATLVLAALTKTFVEDRFRRPPAGGRLARTYVAAAAGMALVVVVSGLLVARVHSLQDDAPPASTGHSPATTPASGPVPWTPSCECPPATGAPVPAPALAAEDKSDAYAGRLRGPQLLVVRTPLPDHQVRVRGPGRHGRGGSRRQLPRR